MVKFFKTPFANNGDKLNIPEELQEDGSISFDEGYGEDYEKNRKTDPDAKNISRQSFNGLLYDITDAIGDIQRSGVAKWSDEITYSKGALVWHNKSLYSSLLDSNKSQPPSASWTTLLTEESLDLTEYRKIDDNVFNGYLQVRSEQEGQETGVFLQDIDGTVRGQVVATDQGLQLTQYPKDGGLQTFTFPKNGEGGELALRREVDNVTEHVVPIPDEPISARELARNLELNTKRTDTIKLCTFNIWGNGGRQNYGNGELANRDYLSVIKKSLLEIGAEYVGLQETYTTPTTNSSDYGIYPLVHSFFGLAHDYEHGRNYGNTSVSTREIIESDSTVYNDPPGGGDNEIRGFTRVVVNVGTTPIAIYNTHLSYVRSRAENMIQELLTAVQSETVAHIVVMGDFNVDYTYLSDFETEGFTIANKKEFNTSNDGSTVYIDNILYRGFSSLVDKNTFDSVPQSAADHKPFYVEVKI